MVSHLFFSQLMLIALVWLCLMLHWLWPSEPAAERLTTAQPILPSRKRSKGPKPFPGLTRHPVWLKYCVASRGLAVIVAWPPPGPPPPYHWARLAPNFLLRSFWIPGSWHLRTVYTDAILFHDPIQESSRAGQHHESHR